MIARLTGLVLACLVFLVVTAAPASAHHVDVSASVSCTGTVTFTARAWPGATAASRTDTAIRVSYSTDGRSFVPLPVKGSYAFDASNRFAFTDSFQLDRPLPGFVIVAAQATWPWADKGAAGAVHTTPRVGLPSCPSSTSTPASARPATPPTSPPNGSTFSASAATSTASNSNTRLIAVGVSVGALLLGAGVWALLRARRA